jgi:hypothetical protein
LLRQCPASEWIKHTGIGMTVLLTSILAGVSAAFALQSVFGSLWVSLPFSLLWAVVIFNIDRFVVSSFRKQFGMGREWLQALPRLLLATGIALVVAKPLEMEVFRSEIRQVLAERRTQRLAALERGHAARMAALDVRQDAARRTLAAYAATRDRLFRDYACECDGTCGTGLKGRGTECRTKQQRYEAAEHEYAVEKRKAEAEAAALDAERARLRAAHASDLQRLDAAFSTGFLARLDALNGLGTLASYAITLLLLLVEVSPVLSKLLAAEGPYDNLLRLSEHEYRLRYMRAVYQQNLDLQPQRHPPGGQPADAVAPPRERADDARVRYAELRRQLRTRLKNR